MPSPFPGMDPYLEKEIHWPDFQTSFVVYMSEFLQPRIRPTYNARIRERIHLIPQPHSYADEPHPIKSLESEFREPYIEIVYLPTGDVVTTIELISPINKMGEGRARYIQKQQHILKTETSLVEIDLLRLGNHIAAVPEERVKEVAGWRYLVSVKRAKQYGDFEVYFVALDSRLPCCRIPLRPPDADAVLDLPAVFERTYEVSGYEDVIDYRELPPPPPLSEEEMAWLDGLLRGKGLRETAE